MIRPFALVALVAVCALAACSGGGGETASTGSVGGASTRPSTSASSAPSAPSTSSTTPDTVASGSCAGALAFGEVAGQWAAAQLRAPTDFSVTDFRRSREGMGWARALLIPDDRRYDAVWVVGRCDGTTWTIVDGGTSAVGCADAVPPDLGVECP